MTAPSSGTDPSWVTLVSAPLDSAAAESKGPGTRGIVVRLGLGVVAVLVAVLLLAGWAAQWLAEREAVNDAANMTDLLASVVIQPALSDAFADGSVTARNAFDDTVRAQVLGDDVVRVKIWTPEGEVLYADQPPLIGRTFDLSDIQLDALQNPSTRAVVSDLSEAENEFDPGTRLVEVYRPVWVPDGRELLFEVYLPYEPVAARSADLWRGFAGVTTSSLLLLAVLTAPIVWGLLRRLGSAERRRAQLLQHAVDASDAERRRIAGTLHDGPVQELVATSFAAETAADAAVRRGDEDAATSFRDVAGAVRGNIRVLRSLLMDIYPPGLRAAGLDRALQDLGATARGRGVAVDVSVEIGLDTLAETDEQLVYRVAQEALRNAVAHAAPCAVRIHVRADGADLLLDVADDGPGFDPDILAQPRADGHLGTRVLIDLARHAGAELAVATGAGSGTCWRLRIPRFADRRAAAQEGEPA